MLTGWEDDNTAGDFEEEEREDVSEGPTTRVWKDDPIGIIQRKLSEKCLSDLHLFCPYLLMCNLPR